VYLQEIEPTFDVPDRAQFDRQSRDRLQALRYGFREELGRATNARWDESVLRPDEAYVSNPADKIVENGDDVRV
jgi:hypothetical protein